MQVFPITETTRQRPKKDLTKDKVLNPFSILHVVDYFSTLQLFDIKFKIVPSNNSTVYPAITVWLQLSFHIRIKISASLWQVYLPNS